MPNYKVGDKVRVLPYEDIRRQFEFGSMLPSGCSFPSIMKEYCGQVHVIVASHASIDGNGTMRYFFEPGGWAFTDEMLEPASEPELRLTISFNDVMGIK